jgi:hypothetical protein
MTERVPSGRWDGWKGGGGPPGGWVEWCGTVGKGERWWGLAPMEHHNVRAVSDGAREQAHFVHRCIPDRSPARALDS